MTENPTASAPALADRWPTSDELDSAVDRFFASTSGVLWDSWEISDLADHIAWFGGTTGRGNLFDWDSTRVVEFLSEIAARVQLSDPARALMFPALLRAWVRFAAVEDGTPALEVRRSLAAIEHAEPVFFAEFHSLFNHNHAVDD